MPNEAALRRLARLVSKAERCLDATPIGHGAVRASTSRVPSAPTPSRPTKWSTRCSSPATAATPGWTGSTSTSGASPCGSWSGPSPRKDAAQLDDAPEWVAVEGATVGGLLHLQRSLGLAIGQCESRNGRSPTASSMAHGDEAWVRAAGSRVTGPSHCRSAPVPRPLTADPGSPAPAVGALAARLPSAAGTRFP
jgi:hypothetical protein